MNREALRLAGVTLSREEPASKRRIAKDYHRNLRRIDEPDEVRKVAACPKCSAWFESVERGAAFVRAASGPAEMPYGIAKRYGGDSPKNDAHMEKQVAAIMRTGKSKVSAIKIAKAQMNAHHTPAHHAARMAKGKR